MPHTNLIKQRVTELYSLAESYFSRSFQPPVVRLDLKGEIAGQAWPDQKLLRFNQTLYLENQKHFLKHVTAHEAAHLITYELYGNTIKPHGQEWQKVMTTIFGVPANRCHSYDTSRSSPRPYLYRCECRGKTIPLSSIRHNRSQKGTIYLCTECCSPLRYHKSKTA